MLRRQLANIYWSQQIAGDERSVKLQEAYPTWGECNKMQNPGESNLSDFFGHFKEYVIITRLNKTFSGTKPSFNIHKE